MLHYAFGITGFEYANSNYCNLYCVIQYGQFHRRIISLNRTLNGNAFSISLSCHFGAKERTDASRMCGRDRKATQSCRTLDNKIIKYSLFDGSGDGISIAECKRFFRKFKSIVSRKSGGCVFDLAINFKIQRLPFTIRSVNNAIESDGCCSSNWTRFRKFVPRSRSRKGIGKSSYAIHNGINHAMNHCYIKS